MRSREICMNFYYCNLHRKTFKKTVVFSYLTSATNTVFRVKFSKPNDVKSKDDPSEGGNDNRFKQQKNIFYRYGRSQYKQAPDFKTAIREIKKAEKKKHDQPK